MHIVCCFCRGEGAYEGEYGWERCTWCGGARELDVAKFVRDNAAQDRDAVRNLIEAAEAEGADVCDLIALMRDTVRSHRRLVKALRPTLPATGVA